MGRPRRTTCKRCDVPIEPRPKGKTGPHMMFCSKECCNLHGRETHLKRRFGLTNNEYFAMLEAQGGGCAICGTDDPMSPGQGSGVGSWHVDHDHDTGKIRGLLCSRCNRGIGWFNDDPHWLRIAATYLEETR